MFSPIACMVCAVDPATTSLLLPLAQATLISAPILLRGHIRRGIQTARRRRGATAGHAAEAVAGTPDDATAPAGEPPGR